MCFAFKLSDDNTRFTLFAFLSNYRFPLKSFVSQLVNWFHHIAANFQLKLVRFLVLPQNLFHHGHPFVQRCFGPFIPKEKWIVLNLPNFESNRREEVGEEKYDFTSLPGGHWIGHSWRIGAYVVGMYGRTVVRGIISKSGGASEYCCGFDMFVFMN